MDKKVIEAIRQRVANEPYAKKMGLKLLKLEPGYALVEMKLADNMANIFDMTHGGAIFSLIDEAFEISCNTHGTVAVALNVSVTYHQSPTDRAVLRAESKEIHRSAKTATYDIRVTEGENNILIATCQALAYRKKEKLPFL
ncbi:MAG: hotdog fold thioesterase [Deltaproteobacteria bacterium]|nr:hotdog fold thioesterase [Deltaproteobacteria bacterium]